MGIGEYESLESVGALFYKRYVDYIFAVFDFRDEALAFLEYLNNRHPNIKFTKEENKNGILPFLDISIDNLYNIKTSVYHKTTYTGLLMNFKSFAPFEYKNRLINTLLDRIYKINSSWNGFDLDVKSLKSSLARNLYPTRLIDRCIRTFLNKIFVSGERDDINKKDLQTRYVILPYIGDYSKVAKK